MPANKRLTDLIDYTAVLPYASELFGIYQPLLGWKSKRTARRFEQGFLNDKLRLVDAMKTQFTGRVQLRYEPDCQVRIDIRPGALEAGKVKAFDSLVLQRIAEALPPYEQYDREQWRQVINRDRIEVLLRDEVAPAYARYYTEQCKSGGDRALAVSRAMVADRANRFPAAFEGQLARESSLAGALLDLADRKQHEALAEIFYNVKNNTLTAQGIAGALAALDVFAGYLSIENMDPQDQEDLKRVALSPISVVHLFRQYFFELDSFLGTPVSHVWLSPGSTVELIEIQTRRVLVEKTIEESLETTTKAERETTEEDEISDAVKEDNKQDIKFGASVTASYASVTATSSFDYGSSQSTAREETHRRMRSQTEKLSTEIRRNFKSTFKTVTETTDTSSKRYVLNNTTGDLVNYELRRKMRQVAVQVQDVGTYLCWQTYVDRPGEQLGVAELVHIAKPADLDGLHAPEEIPLLQPFPETKVVTVPFISIDDTDADNEDEVYKDGVEVDDSEVAGNLEKIQSDFPTECVCPRGGYVLADVEFDGQGKPVAASRKGAITNADNRATFTLHLDSADFQGQNSVQVKLTLHWTPAPGANDAAIKANADAWAKFTAKEQAAHQKAYMENARDRIKLTHSIKRRPSEELREEERIVVYRKLIQEMLTAGITMPDDRTRHVVAELVNSIFDVDKMLYFVAPEWWRPRLRTYTQQLDEAVRPSAGLLAGVTGVGKGVAQKLYAMTAKSTADKLSPATVGWGGVSDPARDNYYITEDSEPARFGSSLGWLLQLDGDNLRNAFLNAPWVKAVIPIRPGKEKAAVNWLKGVEGFNGIGEDDVYQTTNLNEKDVNGNPLNGQKMIDVIMDLAKKIQKKHADGVKTGKYPSEDEIADPQLVDEANVVTSTPIDRVYEHGFYPLQGGFRANVQGNYEIFDQWLEILPTDQVVPVEVKYDPKTGRQV
jgi:hypothetical protein